MQFRATLLLVAKTATAIQVPPEVVAHLGTSRRPAVVVTINGYTYRNTVAPWGKVYMFPVSAEVRAQAGIAAGDEVTVDLVLDSEPRTVEVPPDLAAALAKDPVAQRAFAALSYSHQRRHVLAVEGAKAAETRQRRIASTITMLREGRT